MDQLIAKIAKKTGLDEAHVRKAIQIVLSFLHHDGPADEVKALFAKLPGANAMLQHSGATDDVGGLGRLFGGGLGAMGAFNELTSAGLEMGQIQTVLKEIDTFARESAGDELVDNVVDAIPGLRQVI
ncbi:DUF2267 domain-containing protein [Pseudoxanthobacter sp.]|uniref:DUF2267 domain-containing protein n=1 Tax=Pseudoxanthobacter sp. TaxID=1925742 RepID=UPI002FE3D87C